MNRAPVVQAAWPAPRGVHAFTTLRHGAGVSQAPFDHFNLGNKYAADGDDPATVARNRAQLAELAGLPSAPHWLKQVHGTDVVRVD
ncbi:MAG: laccase domain-containing protein, partial [Pseudoxanthomonas sp.]|nr:laccase domain-containing protein [Pseudoxanthomonas sp.]